MKMTFRWFGEEDDVIPLRHIAQIPGIYGVVTSLNLPAGEVWDTEKVLRIRGAVQAAGLRCEVIESVNIHESIKLGLPERDEKIENYIATMKNLRDIGVKVICYNFMPVLDWVRTELYRELPDGSKTMSYDPEFIKNTTPAALAERYFTQCGGVSLPGWEPERLKYIGETIAQYSDMTREQYLKNAGYFLNAVIPFAEEYDIKMALHPDDPPESVFGLPRIAGGAEDLSRYLALYDSVYNGIALCTGSLGANPRNNLPEMIHSFAERIHFAHIRNLKYTSDGGFHESAHLSESGSLDIYAIVKAFADVGFDGYVRPDHGRMIWEETGRPGYGLYDRALGAVYLAGLWEGIVRNTEDI